jgi:hypothetical protein
MIQLKAKFDRAAAAHLYETPLSDDQTIDNFDADHVIVTATVRETAQLEWWLRGFGSRVDVQEPIGLRQRMVDAVGELYKEKRSSLTETAMAIASWNPSRSTMPPFPLAKIETELRGLSAPYERACKRDIGRDESRDRSFLRAVRYLRRIQTEGVWAHSHLFDFFIPDHHVPTGHSKHGGNYREHVVPCVYLRDEVLQRFDRGNSDEEVADFLRSYLVIVKITKQEQKRLDRSEKNGGLGLKDSMPKDWQLNTGCIFQRLHDAEIKFDPPEDFQACTH